MLLNLVDNGGVLEDGLVVCEVYLGRLLRESLNTATGIFVALLKGLEGVRGGSLESEGLGNFGPVKFEGCTAL